MKSEEVNEALAELERIRGLLAETLKASATVAQERANEVKDAQNSTKITKDIENTAEIEYNGNIKYSTKAQRGRTIEIETMENNRFIRLRQFGDDLPKEWYAFTRDYFYIYSNHSYMDYTILAKARIIDSNRQDINNFVEELENGINYGTGAFDTWISSFRRGKGRNSWHSIRTRKTRSARRNDGMDVQSSRSDNIGDTQESSGYSESEVKHSLNSYPKLNKSEWTLLNDRLEVELHNSNNFIDDYTKWLYATKNNTRVFAIYGIGWGDDATPLYAVGGIKADKAYEKMQRFMEGENEELNRSGEDFESWLNSYTVNKGKSGNSISNDGNRGTDNKDGSVHSGQQASNGEGINGGSTENRNGVKHSLKGNDSNNLIVSTV